MAITAGELSILLTAKDQMTQVLKGAQDEMENTKKKGFDLKKAFGVVAKGTAIVGAAAVAAGGALLKMAADAAPVAGVRAAFQGISGDADTMLAALQEGSAGMVTQADLMGTYNSAAQLVGKTFADELPNAMGFLGKASAATGEDMGFMLDSLVKGVGRLSPMILDNLGIQVDLVAANEAYAASIGVAASELTKEQQQAALMAQAMELLEKNTAAMPEVTGSMTQKLEEARVMFQDTKMAVGEALIPVLSKLADLALPLVKDAIEKIVPFAEDLAAWLGEKIPEAIEAGAQFFEDAKVVVGELQERFEEFSSQAIEYLTPFMEKVSEVFGVVKEWLSDTIPAALEWLRDNWDSIWEAIQTVVGVAWEGIKIYFQLLIDWYGFLWDGLKFLWDKFQDAWPAIKDAVIDAWNTIQPKLENLVLWLQENIPAAIEAAKDFFENKLKPAVASISAFLTDTLFPAFQTAVAWLQENIPTAIETAKQFFEETLNPAMETVSTFMTDTVFPTFETIVTWLSANIPAAISVLESFWLETLQPALETIYDYLQDPIIPTFMLIVSWLETTIPDAIAVLTKFWLETLLPAITDVWEFINRDLIPLFDALAELFNVALTLAITALTGLWQNVLQPALEDIWAFVKDNIIPIFDAIGKLLKDTVGPIIDSFRKNTVDPLTGAIGGISGAIQGVIDWVGRMADKLRSIKLPGWLTPGSPTPFETGLVGIAKAGAKVVKFLKDMDKAIPDSEKMGKLASNFNQLFSGAAGIAKGMAGLSDVGDYTSPDMAKLKQIAIDAADVVDVVWEIFTRIYEPDADGDYPGLEAFQQEAKVLGVQSTRIGQAVSIMGKMISLKELDDYTSPDLAKIYQMAKDAADMVDVVWEVFTRIYEADEDSDYPGLVAFAQEAKVLGIQSTRIGQAVSIMGKMLALKELDDYTSPDLAKIYQMAKDAADVVDVVWEVFTRIYEADEDSDYPGLIAFAQEAKVLGTQANRIGSALGILGKMLSLKELDEYTSPDIAKVEQMAKDAAIVVDAVWDIFSRVYEPDENGDYPGLVAFEQESKVLAAQSGKIGAALSILGSMLSLKELSDYVSPDMAKVEQMAKDAATVVDAVWTIFSRVYEADENGDYPGLEAFTQESKVLAAQSGKIGAALSILGSMLSLKELSDYVSPDMAKVDQMAKDAAVVVDKVWEIFARVYEADENGDYPGLDAFAQESKVLAAQSGKIGSALSILGSMLSLKELDEYTSPDMAKVDQMAKDASEVVDAVWTIFSRVYEADEEGNYPGLVAFTQESKVLAAQSGKIGAALSILGSMLGLKELSEYTSPDIAKVEQMAKDASVVVDAVWEVFSRVYDADESGDYPGLVAFEQEAKVLSAQSGKIGAALSILGSMLSLKELDEYASPDIAKVTQMAKDAAVVVDAVWTVFSRIYEADENGDYPGLVAFEQESKVLAAQSGKIGAALAILGSMLSLKELDEYTSPDIAKVDQMAKDAALVVDAVWAVFSRVYEADEEGGYPGLIAFEQEAKVLGAQAGKIGSALGILGSMLGLKELDDYKSPDLSKVDQMAKDAAVVVDAVWEIFSRIYEADDDGEYPGLVAFEQETKVLAGQAGKIGSALSILGGMLALKELDDYVSPDMDIIALMATDAKKTVAIVSAAVADMFTSAEEMAPKITMLETVAGMVSTVKSTITDTIDVAQGLTEMSWREVKQHQVDSFTKNLANIVAWLTDPVGGIAAIKGLTDMAGYAQAAKHLGKIVTAVVVAVREVMTLPAVWDARMTVISSGMAAFMTQIAQAILTEGAALTSAWQALGRNILDAMTFVLNDGAWRQLGERNANAYKAGWEAALGIASPSKVMMEMGKNAREGFNIGANGGAVTNNYNLNVTTTQPAVNLVGSYRMLEAMG